MGINIEGEAVKADTRAISYRQVGAAGTDFSAGPISTGWEKARIKHAEDNAEMFHYEGKTLAGAVRRLNKVLQPVASYLTAIEAEQSIIAENSAQKNYVKWIDTLSNPKKTKNFVEVTAAWPTHPSLPDTMRTLKFTPNEDKRMVVKLNQESGGAIVVWDNRVSRWRVYQYVPDADLHAKAEKCRAEIAGGAPADKKDGIAGKFGRKYSDIIAEDDKQMSSTDPQKSLKVFGMNVKTPVNANEHQRGKMNRKEFATGCFGIKSMPGDIKLTTEFVDFPEGIQIGIVNVEKTAGATAKATVEKYGNGFVAPPYLRRLNAMQEKAKQAAMAKLGNEREKYWDDSIHIFEQRQTAGGRSEAYSDKVDPKMLVDFIPPANKTEINDAIGVKFAVYDSAGNPVALGMLNPGTGDYIFYSAAKGIDMTKVLNSKMIVPPKVPARVSGRNSGENRVIGISVQLDKTVKDSTKYAGIAYFSAP